MLLWMLLGCNGDIEPTNRTVAQLQPGPPVAGVAEAPIDFPMGAPLGGYTGRCTCFGGDGVVDGEDGKRDSAYIESFAPTVGVQTRATAKALWLENGDQDLVIIKTDSIYSFDNLVEVLEEELEAATGIDMDGKVVHTTSHSHNTPANYDQGITWYLGGDKYNPEVFERMTASLVDVALAAWESRQPASLGLGYAKDWDPDDEVYRDRRPENDTLEFFDDIDAGAYKDPYLAVLRVDTANGDPMGVFFNFGMHGTALGQSNPMVSVDSTGHVEIVVAEYFDTPVVVAQLQSGGGDASPAGFDSGFANLESIGINAADAIVDLWESVPTSSNDIRLETATRSVDQSRDVIRVTRGGTIDLYYTPYDEDLVPDEEVYNDDGSIASPIDEFNGEFGGAFCGSDLPLIPGSSLGSTTYPYDSCIDVYVVSRFILAFFSLEEEDVVLPLPESLRANLTASRLGPIPIMEADGTETSDDLLLAFFPGETTAMYTEWFRRRAEEELGFSHTMPIGYSQDHEGYLMIPEDWLMGGYEPNINVWGPLQGEYLMEQLLSMSEDILLTDSLEPVDLFGEFQPTEYAETSLPNSQPDTTPTAGTIVDTVPEDLYVPLNGLTKQPQPDLEIARVQGIAQLVWEGGDPSVDLPVVTLEQQTDAGWVAVTTAAGRTVNDTLPDIITTHLPDPLYPYENSQTHTWWAGWQAVGHHWDRTALEVGVYRLHVAGQSYEGGDETWPWTTTEYEVTSDSFAVIPAAVSLDLADNILTAWLEGPDWGYRLIDPEGTSTGANPVEDGTVVWTLSDGSTSESAPVGTIANGVTSFSVVTPDDAISITFTDPYGNTGELSL